MAHEATHVVQQGAAGTRQQPQPHVAEIQRLPMFIGERLADYSRHIPGYTLFTVIVGVDPLRGARVEPTPRNLVGGLLGLVPFGTLIFDELVALGVIDDALAFVDRQLATFGLSLARLERLLREAWDEMDFLRLDPFAYNLAILVGRFSALLADVRGFAASLVDAILGMIKNAAIGLVDRFLADRPAWSLIKKVLGHDPLRDEPVDATTVEVLEDFLLLIGREEELEQMRVRGTLQETADWIDTQLATFHGLLGELRSLFEAALDAIRPENLPSLGTNLEGLVARAVGLLQGVWDFAGTVASEVLRLIKNALLGWLSEFAHELPGFELLTVILGRNPFTAEPVPRTAETLIRGFITLLPGGRAVYEELAQTGVVGEAASRIEGAMGELGISWEMVTGLFQSIWSGLSIHDLIDPVGAFTRIRDQFGEPIARLFAFVRIVIREMFSLVLALMNFPSDVVGRIIANAMQAYEDIRRDPIGFLINTLATVKAGFSRFFGAIFDHLLGGLIDWLFRGLRQAGIEPPSALTLETALDLVLQVLGITTTRLWEKLAERIGQERVDQIRGVMDRLEGLWNFVRDVHEGGLVKLWEYIEGQITDLWDVIIEQARSWIMETIVNRVVARLLSMLDPTGVMAVVNSFIAFFNAIQSAIEYVREILAIIDDYVATMAAVARGDVEPGAARLEQGLVSAIPVAIGFLANQVGLGNVGDKIEEIIGGLRAMVDRALDWLLDQAERLLDSLLRGLGVLGDEDDGSEDGEGAIREEFDLASQGHAIFIDASGRLMVASGDPQPVSGLAELRALHDEYRALPEDATTAARRRTIQKMITVIKAHPHLLLSTVEEGIGDPPNLGDIRPHRSQTPRYRPPSGLEAYAPLWELLSEHVIPRSFVDALFSAFRLEKPKVEESEYGAMRTILIYRGAASRKTEGAGGDNSVYQVLRETAAEIMAVVMGSSQPGLHFDVGKETVQNLFERYAENALDRTAEAVIEEHASGAEGHEKTKGELRGTPPRPTYGRLEEAFEAQAEDVVEMLGDRLR